jgi:hypothetical protein
MSRRTRLATTGSHAAADHAAIDGSWRLAVRLECGFTLDWLDLPNDKLANTLASARNDILACLTAQRAEVERLTGLQS